MPRTPPPRSPDGDEGREDATAAGGNGSDAPTPSAPPSERSSTDGIGNTGTGTTTISNICYDCGGDASGDKGEVWWVPDDEWGLTKGRPEYKRGRMCLPCGTAWRKERAEAGLPETEDYPG